MSKVKIEYGDENGWSRWVTPIQGYRFVCCDCGLSHEMEFRIDSMGHFNFRARRHQRSTAQLRRKPYPIEPVGKEMW